MGAAAATVVTMVALLLGSPGVGSARSHSIRVGLGGSSVHASGDGAFVLPVVCRDGGNMCSLQITVSAVQRHGQRSPRAVIARRTVSLGSNASHGVRMTSTPRGLRLLVSAPRYRLSISVNINATDAGGRTTSLAAIQTESMAAAATRCWPHGSSTIVRDAGGRIFDFPAGKTGKSLNRNLARTDGCLYSRGRPYALDNPDARHGKTQIGCLGKRCAAIAAPYAAYGDQTAFPSCLGAPGCPTPLIKVSIMDLRTGRIVSSTLDSHNLPVSIAVSRVPVAAWTIETSINGSLGYAVHALTRHGLQQIAESTGISPGFIRVSGRTVRWRDNGQPRSKTLPAG